MKVSKANLLLTILVLVLAAVSIGLLVAYIRASNAQNPHMDEAKVDESLTVHDEDVKVHPSKILTHPWEKEVRLPEDVLPVHYNLYLHPNLDTGLFSGRVDVSIEVSGLPKDHLRLHVKELDISSAKLFRGQTKTQEIKLMEAFEYEDNEYYVMRPVSVIQTGKYTMAFEFSGNLTKSIVGFYKSVYTNAFGEQVPIATSKFQPTDARRAFPCFDEPSFKSTFTVTLVRPSDGYIALSNMPVETEIPNAPSSGLTEVKFEKSVPMVTYLACFIVCDFVYKEKMTEVHETKFRVYATPPQKDRIQYALDIGANITDFFTNYFDVPYPLPKQDMIAIPDFISGAMEHWGLITYRETNILYDSRESSTSNKQRIATVISHELAHQWFGNLVTLKWWDDLWLNEGFASYMEYKGVANYHPSWEIESQFLSTDLQRVMDLDATINSHPIVQSVEHPDQITEIFDAISYSKGASVLRMLENFMGKEDFRNGVSNFLKKYKYKHAVTDDLWSELTAVSSQSTNLNISHIMNTWTRQMGLPVITVERVDEGRYKLTQSRYLLDASQESKSEPSPYEYRWEIPITWITQQNPEDVQQTWLTKDEDFMEISIPTGSSWIKFNVGQFGYYRVNYPLEDWMAFSEILKDDHEVLSVSDRVSLINDAFALAESGHLKYSIPLAMIQYLKNEKSFVPWTTALKKLKNIESLLRDTEVYPLLRKYLLSLVEEHYNDLGWNDVGSHSEKLNRVIILHLACRNGHSDCMREAGRLFKEWIDNFSYIAPNLRSLVYRYGMQELGDADSWQVMLERFIGEQNAQEKKKLLYGLAYANKPWIINQFLRLAKNESIIRSQDYITALDYVAQNPIGTSIVWDFIRNEWDYLVDRFSLNNRYLGRLPKYISENFHTPFRLQEMKEFFAKYPKAGAGKRARKQALEAVENNIEWVNKRKEDIFDWLLNNPTQ